MRTVHCLLAALLLTISAAASAAPPTQIALTSGQVLSHSTVARPGVYRLADPGTGAVQITGHDITIDLRGTALRGKGVGSGIMIHAARNVTLENADVSGYRWGIVIEKSQGIHIQHCRVSRNGDLPPGTIIDESGSLPQDDHGGGIVLRDSTHCLLSHDAATHEWDGIDVVRSDHNIIEDSDFSYNNNWGVHFWASSGNQFQHNQAVWCTTGAGALYQALTGWQTYDAQAVAIEHNSNGNIIAHNDLRFGGDGIFIRANEGPATPGGPPVPVKNGSHRNRLMDNDCSFSPNNAIEVDLVNDTVIVGNNCSNSNYGMWLGISQRCIVRNNLCVDDSKHAVEIERGQNDLFQSNTFGNTKPRPEPLVYLRANGPEVPSGPYTIRHNLFFGAKTAVQLDATPATFSGNLVRYAGADGPAVLVKADAQSQVTDAGNNVVGQGSEPAPHSVVLSPRSVSLPAREDAPGPIITLTGQNLLPSGGTPPLVTVNGFPVYLASTQLHLTFVLPQDFDDRPAAQTVTVRCFNGSAWSKPLTLTLHIPSGVPLITAVTPTAPTPGSIVTLTGRGLAGAHVLLEGKPADVLSAGKTSVRVRLPQKLYFPAGFNILLIPAGGEPLWPQIINVDVPITQRPHIIAASFSPLTLKVGDQLKVTFTIKNNAAFPADPSAPGSGYSYAEGQNYGDKGLAEEHGKLYLRASTDADGSWPYLWGIGDTPLAPGETRTITGYITMKTPGTQTYRVGLVSGGIAFIDDSLFRTQVTVTP